MRLKDLGRSLFHDKKVVRNGFILITFATLMLLLLLKIDQVGGALSTVFSTVAPLVYGFVLAYILNVFVHFFEDIVFRPFKNSKSKAWAKMRRPLSVTMAYMVMVAVVVFICGFIIPSLIQSLGTIADTAQKTVPGYANAAAAWLNDFAKKYDLTFIQKFITTFNWSGLLSSLTKFTSDFLTSLMGVTFNVASGVFTAIMAFIFSIYMLFGKEKLQRGVRSLLLAYLPVDLARSLSRVGALTNKVFFSFIRGQLTECCILGTLCYVGMSLLGLDYALLISSIVALGALIPILGAYIGAILGVIVLLLVNPLDSLIFLIFLLTLQQVEGNLIYPRVVGSSIGLPPIWTMFAVLFWGGIMGIPGILIGTPATAVVYRLLRTSVRRRLRERQLDPSDPVLCQLPDEEEEVADAAPSVPEKTEEPHTPPTQN